MTTQQQTQGGRTLAAAYPDFSGELKRLEKEGPTAALVGDIIEKHQPNANYNRTLHRRYRGMAVPIFNRRERFDGAGAVNHRLNNDFFGEIIDMKTGYFAGVPIGYHYRKTTDGDSGAELTGGRASRVLRDFVAESNLFDIDMECTKNAAICGYAARLFYHDPDGRERVMAVLPYQAAILAEHELTEPAAAVRYFYKESGGKERLYAEFYDAGDTILFFEGDAPDTLEQTGRAANLFNGCPLQGIPNNGEMMGDGEKVLELIDAYDRALSDANNESESFANAYMVFENVNIDEEEIQKGRKTGAFQYWNGVGAGASGNISFLTKDINDDFVENHLDRLQSNIYRFSQTPNLSDESFGQHHASGIALRFKMTGLETKCGMFQAKMQSAGRYMFRLLSDVWAKKGLRVDPLRCLMEFHRNFPMDMAQQAKAVEAMVGAGLPKRVAFNEFSFVDDIEQVMQLQQQEAHQDAENSDETSKKATVKTAQKDDEAP